ncbi:MAG: acyl-ACP thioesterase domain-containing protein [Desulfuromonadales bacterium]
MSDIGIHLSANSADYVFDKYFIVQSYEADQHNFARPVALLNYMQSAAGEHATLLGVAVSDLRKSGHTWVLSRVHLAVDRYPRGGETVHIRTWPAARDTLFTLRDFELLDTDGAIIGRATTSWAVLSIKNRRPVKLVNVLPVYPIRLERALADSFATLPEFAVSSHELRLPVLRGDLDINRHVNNTIYAGWALEAIPEEVDSTRRLASIEIAFRAEAFYGDIIVARTAQVEGTDNYLHRIENGHDGRELARLRTRWLPLEQTSRIS